jgi:nucleotide-binding universal stress UspA family protein
MLRLLRVVPPVKEVRNDDDQVIAYVDQETARVVNEAYDYLRRLARPVEGVPIAETVRVGDDVLEIVEESEAVGADLIAIPGYRLSDRGPQPDSRLARRLQRATTIPVLVVPAAEPVAA